eukprot:3502032-Alexandrium_andersonii.AAC.1
MLRYHRSVTVYRAHFCFELKSALHAGVTRIQCELSSHAYPGILQRQSADQQAYTLKGWQNNICSFAHVPTVRHMPKHAQ